MLRSGEVLGEFRIVDEIGRGGMAIVYRAIQLSLGREVALKVLPKHLSDNPRVVARFEREARAIAALSHPGIIPIYTVGSDRGMHYFAMKMVEGSSLAGRLGTRQRMAPRDVGALVSVVCDAVHYAHEHGIVHRDLKPSNILLDEEGRPVVTDFGIAKVLEAEGLTEDGSTLGTTHYMAPEQVLGGDVDRRSDVYSLGVMAFHMLAGEPPFDGDTPYAVAVKQVHDDPPSLAERVPGLPEIVETVVGKAMAKDANARYPSAKSFAQSLEAACADVGGPVWVGASADYAATTRAPSDQADAIPFELPPRVPEWEPEWDVSLLPVTPRLLYGGLWLSSLFMLVVGLFGVVFSVALYLSRIMRPLTIMLAAVPLTLGVCLLAAATANRGGHIASVFLLPRVREGLRGQWAERGLARILDLLLVTLPSCGLLALLCHEASELAPGLASQWQLLIPRWISETVRDLWVPLAVLANAIYYARWNTGGRRTIGKRALGLRVVDEHGRALNRSQAALRWLVECVVGGLGMLFWGAGLVNYLWALWDPNGRALHDYLSRTVVIKDPANDRL